jgi:hypothetical protein
MASIFVPVILLIIFGFTPLKQKPKIAYGITGALAVLIPFVALLGGDDLVQCVLASALVAGFFWWGYKRAARKLTAGKSVAS